MNFTTIAQAKKETNLSYIGGVNISAKIKKNLKVSNNLTYIIYMAPSDIAGYNVCPMATKECKIGCLSTSGRAAMSIIKGDNKVMGARIRKTRLFFENQAFFMDWVIMEIKRYKAQAKRKGYDFSIRLNGTSDIDWANVKHNGVTLFEMFPDVMFYDYTKNAAKFFNLPKNYNLTYSFTGRNTGISEKILKAGFNVAVVFNVKNEKDLPKKFMGYPVVNGDFTDFRPNDGKGVIIGLKWKNIANKADNEMIKHSIFVVQPNDKRCEY